MERGHHGYVAASFAGKNRLGLGAAFMSMPCRGDMHECVLANFSYCFAADLSGGDIVD
jgi:hypothetical protein